MDKLVLTNDHLGELNAIIAELPYKHAVVIIAFMQRRIREQHGAPTGEAKPHAQPADAPAGTQPLPVG